MDAKTSDDHVICTFNRSTLSGEISYDNCIVVIPIEDQKWVFRFKEAFVVREFRKAVDAFRATDSGASGCSAKFKVIPVITTFGFELVSTSND